MCDKNSLILKGLINYLKMDDILKKFDSALTYEENEKLNDYESLYKYWGKSGNQEERRKEILDLQKVNRNINLDQFRGLFDSNTNDVDSPIFENKKVPYVPNLYVPGFNRGSPDYRNVLMMSEWLVEKPEDFHENWYVVPCPLGVRVLVVSDKGKTKLFSKKGLFLKKTRTSLPGGNPGDYLVRTGNFCALDAFYVEKNNTLYVLDLLAWNSQPMTSGETQFRQFWLKTHLQEIDRLHSISKENKILFELLPMVSCEKESFSEFMTKYPQFESNFPLLDGLLFYHKLANYTAGQTPLVGWLFPYMVREILGSDIPVHSVYEAERPPNYTNQVDFIEEFNNQPKKKRKMRKLSSSSMETEAETEKVEEESETAVDIADLN